MAPPVLDAPRVIRSPAGNRVRADGHERRPQPVRRRRRPVRRREPDDDPRGRWLGRFLALSVSALYGSMALIFFLRAHTGWAVHVASIDALREQARARQAASRRVEPRRAELPLERQVGRVATTRGPEGQLTQLVGPSPRAVLEAYCSLGAVCLPDPALELARDQNRSSGTRFGLYPVAAATWEAIAIVRRREDRRWAVGDGKTPIAGIPLEQVALDTERVRVKEGSQ